MKRSLLLFIFFFNSAYALTIEPILEARTLNLTQSTSNPDGDYKYESDGFATGFGLKVEGNPGTGIIGLDYRYGSSDYKLSTPDGSSLTSKLQYQRMMLYFKYQGISFLPLWFGLNPFHRYKDKSRDAYLNGASGFTLGFGLRFFKRVQLNMEISYSEFDHLKNAGDTNEHVNKFYGTEVIFSMSFPFDLSKK